MKKSILTLSLVCFAVAFTSCRDANSEPETVVVEKKVVKDEASEDQSLLEEAAAEIDNEVKEEVSEEIDKIGDNK